MSNRLSLWRHYIPALFLAGLGMFFVYVPSLAAALVIGTLFLLAIAYAFIVRKMHQLRRAQTKYQQEYQSSSDFGSVHVHGPWEPNIRNVTMTIMGRRDSHPPS